MFVLFFFIILEYVVYVLVFLVYIFQSRESRFQIVDSCVTSGKCLVILFDEFMKTFGTAAYSQL